MTETQKTKKSLRKEVRRQTITYITAAFGLIAGLAWNDAVKAFIEFIFPASSNGVFAKFFYALLITLIVVVLTMQLTKFADGEE